MANFSDDEKFEIKEILEQRKRKGVLEYLVSWKGASDENNSWEPAKTIGKDCEVAVQLFQAKAKAAAKAKRSTSRSRKVSRSRSRSSSRSRKSKSSTSTEKERQTRSRSRGRSQKKEDQKEEKLIEAAEKKTAALSNSSTSVQASSSKSSQENSIVEKKVEAQETMAVRQRVTRSSTMEARKELEVQRVHNEQRPKREDDNKPRSIIWKVADYAVIVLFVLSLLAALFMFAEKFFDLEDFKNQALPNMTVLKKRLVSAQKGLVDLGQAGIDMISSAWLYVVEQIKGPAGAAKDSAAPKPVPAAGA